jgi:hypothetical protein
LALAILGLVASCERGGTAASNADAGHEGQGEEVSADPQFEIRMAAAGGSEQTFSARAFAVYQAKPPKGEERERPQTFELRGEGFTIAGRLPEALKLAPQRKFAQLVGQSMEVRTHGGDPTAPSMSKITTPGGEKVYVARGGTLTIEKAFHRKGQYAGVSGKFEVELQEIKLGNPDDPDNREDKPVGQPVKAAGTFTARADSYPFEQL